MLEGLPMGEESGLLEEVAAYTEGLSEYWLAAFEY
jgi:hypothetical protein